MSSSDKKIDESSLITGDEALKETVLDDVELSGKDSFIKLHRLTVELPNGEKSRRDIIRHPGACAMIALDQDGTIFLERQWRTPLSRAFWELPAGKIDPNEPSLDCAKRELEEEVGVKATDWVKLGTMHNAIGYSDEHIDVYLAQGLSKTHTHLDDNEFLRIEKRPWKEVLQMTYTGEITDAKTISAMHWFAHYLNQKK